ncbi:MAG: WecB/TagA/CpsF family glycosyltransferase [Patescibacteria group bacterium]|jgi:N-acetylglucosaminyldiphosphoundecaprenol N-acetyl-beta-D-mannosaminyltransferase
MARILGIKISTLNRQEISEHWDLFLASDRPHLVTTPNPEIILAAREDEEYFYILNQADLAIADGFGLVLAGRLSGQKFTRLTGSDITPELLTKAEAEAHPVAILNWQAGLSSAAEIETALKKSWPQLNFKILDIPREARLTEAELKLLENFSPKIVFCTLGAPWQEKLLWRSLPQLKSARIAIGVGGSFDFITKKTIRAPQFWRQLGLEWLWRLIKQPRRLKRIWRATVVFGLRVLKETLINPLIYRRNVVILIYSIINKQPRILIVERQDEPGHWQLPQGGTDGQSLKKSGLREAKEELGLSDLKVRGVYPKLHSYRFKSGHNKKTNYKGQSQGLLIAEFLGTDDEVTINYWDHSAWRWVKPEELVKAVHPVRRPGAEKFLNKFLETIKYE